MNLRIDPTSYEQISAQSRYDDMFAIYSTGPDEGMDQIREALSGRHDFIREKLLKAIVRHKATSLTAVEASLLAAQGIDPLAVVALGVHASYLLLLTPDQDDDEDADAQVAMDRDDPRHSYIRLGNAVYWRFKGQVDVALPESMKGAIPTGPLRDVVQHPVLDTHDLRIVDVKTWHDTDTMLEVVGMGRKLKLADLANYRPTL